MRDEKRKPAGSKAEPTTPAESWRRNTEILDLVNRIRTARRRRASDVPAPPRR